MNPPQPDELNAELDERAEAQRAAWLAKREQVRAQREEFREARTYGLRARHAEKLRRNRNKREQT